MMVKAFLTSEIPDAASETAVVSPASPDPQREKVRILVIGSSPSVDRVIQELYRLGFAEICEWSSPQSTGRSHEVMRILTRWILAR